MTMNKAVFKCCIAVSIFSMALPASANLQVFTDRTAWLAASGGGSNDLFQDFNSYTSDVLYNRTNPVTAGFLTLLTTTNGYDTSWRIDAPPTTFGSIPSVNGSTFATTLAPGGGWANTVLTFTPVKALGFDYAGASYSQVNGTLITSLGESVTFAKLDPSARSFIGFLYTEGATFSSLTWGTSGGNFAAGIDNVEAVRAVPEPEEWAMLMVGIPLVGWQIRRKQRVVTVEA